MLPSTLHLGPRESHRSKLNSTSRHFDENGPCRAHAGDGRVNRARVQGRKAVNSPNHHPSADDERQFTELRLAPIAHTIGSLHRRIEARFPGSGLSRVAAELIQLGELNATVMHQLVHPNWWLRGLITLAVAGLFAIALWASIQLVPFVRSGVGGIADALQSVEAATNEIILLSLAVLFLISLETRVKRRVALRMLHRFRSIAHVVDMHQLTKDPDLVVQSTAPTDASPERTLTKAELGRYLDYCSELLALVSKLAAVLAQHQQDPVVLGAVNEVEVLTSSLSRKIWQKITILQIAETGRS